jgi:hypothetical protein
MDTVSTSKATVTSVCRKIIKTGSGENSAVSVKDHLELPIILLEMAIVVQTLIEFGHVQKLAAHIRLHWGAKAAAYGADPGRNEKTPTGQK